jgi:hypothetical protein
MHGRDFTEYPPKAPQYQRQQGIYQPAGHYSPLPVANICCGKNQVKIYLKPPAHF